MTFAEKLREIATALDRIGAADDGEVVKLGRISETIDALADYADGRALVMPSVFLSGDLVISIIEARNRAGVSADAGVSKSQLQGFVDSEDGRVMPK